MANRPCGVAVGALTRADADSRVARLIYQADPYIYPALFGSREVATRVMPSLIRRDRGPFSARNIRAATREGDVLAVAVVLDGPDPLVVADVREAFADQGLVPPSTLPDVVDRYFAHIADERGRYVLVLAVDPRHRGQGLGGALLTAVSREPPRRQVSLHVLSDNAHAARLYARLGFVVVGVEAGYSPDPLRSVEVLRMVRPAPGVTADGRTLPW